jgi:hypothetical protein
MSKFDWNAWAAADYEQPGRIRQLIADLREASALLSKLDPPLKPEQQQLQLEAPAPIAPQVNPQPAVRSGVLDEEVPESSAEKKDRNKCHWTAAERARAEALIDWGTSMQGVAEMMGRTAKGIQSALSVGTLKPKTWKPDARHQASGRRSAVSRGYTLRNGVEAPPDGPH